MITGLEPALAKSASSSIARVAAPVGGRLAEVLRRRKLKREFNAGASTSETSAFLENLDAETAAELVRFAESPELKSLAMGLAADSLLKSAGSSAKASKQFKAQLSSLLRLNTSLKASDLEAAVEFIFAIVSETTSSLASEILEGGDRLSPTAKASILKVQESYIDSAIRNSTLLSEIRDLSSHKTFEDQFRLQVKELYGTMRLPHAGTTKRVPYDKLYVQPHVRPPVEGSAAAAPMGNQRLAIGDLMKITQRLVLLGDPGGGKSTLSLKMTFDCASGRDSYHGESSVPFLVVLREYAQEMSAKATSLLEYIEQQCKILFSIEPPPGVIDYLLLNGRALVIFDGLDELLDTALRRRVVDVVTGFTNRYPATPVLVTSRRIGYSDAPLDPELFPTFTLCEFNPEQVAQYARNWFELDESIEPGRQQGLCQSFLADSAFVNDLRVNPLMLSLMCGIYASEHYIPRNRPDVYEKCALLLFDSWDKQRGIKSSLPFDAHVQASMRSLALWLYPQQASQGGLPRQRLINYMKEYLLKKRFDNEEEAENAATEFIDFCKGRAWVLTDVGAELYGFTHRTFLEYFAASQIVRENTDPVKLFNYLLPRLQNGGWEVVAQLALQLLNKSVEDGADDFLDVLLVHASEESDPELRDKLLSFAAQALTYIVPRPPVLRELAAQIVGGQNWADSRGPGFVLPLQFLLSASPENLPLVSKYLYDSLASLLTENPTNISALFTALYADVIARRGLFHGGTDSPRGSSVQFWTDQISANVHKFETAIDAQKTLETSVALYLFEYGICTARDVISWHGAKSIIAVPVSSPLARVDSLPLAVRVLLRMIDPDMNKSLAGGRTRITCDAVEELKDALLELHRPWFIGDRNLELSGFVSYFLTSGFDPSGRVASASATLLLLMAVFDYATNPLGEPGEGVLRNNSKVAGQSLVSAAFRAIELRNMLVYRRHLDGKKITQEQWQSIRNGGESADMRGRLLAAGVDENVISLVEAWVVDPRVRLVARPPRKLCCGGAALLVA